MRKLIFLFFVIASIQCNAQANLFTVGECITAGPPNFSPGARGCRTVLDISTMHYWIWQTGTTWTRQEKAPDQILGCSAPLYVPTIHQSDMAINQCSPNPILYKWNGAVWQVVGGSGGSGTVTTDATLSGDGSIGTPLKIAQQAATSGQVLKWNGTTWLPAADGGTTYTGGTGIDVTGTVITNTAPDQTVSIAGAGINAVTGTYPSFTITGTEVDGSTTNELQNLSLSGQALSISGGTGATLPIIGVSGGYGINVATASGTATASIDTTKFPSIYGTQSVYKLWPKGNVTNYQPSTSKRNWIIYNQNIQSTSTRNAFMKFDTITNLVGSTTNGAGNGIWMGTSTSVADMLSGFSNQIQHGGGFNLFGSGFNNFTDWRASGTRGSILKALNWSDGSGDAAISFFRSQTSDVRNGLTQLEAGEEIAAIRFAAADTTRALSTTKTFDYPLPCAAIVGYTFGKQFNNAHYGGIGFWTTNGSLTQVRAVAVDSTFSTTVRAGINVVPSSGNTLQVAGKTAIAGNLELTTAGNKILIATGANASAGTATLVGGTVTVNTTAVTSNSIFYITCKTPITAQGKYSVPTIVNGTSFTINSDSVADNSIVYWTFFN